VKKITTITSKRSQLLYKDLFSKCGLCREVPHYHFCARP